jgi:hypothetical protein
VGQVVIEKFVVVVVDMVIIQSLVDLVISDKKLDKFVRLVMVTDLN